MSRSFNLAMAPSFTLLLTFTLVAERILGGDYAWKSQDLEAECWIGKASDKPAQASFRYIDSYGSPVSYPEDGGSLLVRCTCLFLPDFYHGADSLDGGLCRYRFRWYDMAMPKKPLSSRVGELLAYFDATTGRFVQSSSTRWKKSVLHGTDEQLKAFGRIWSRKGTFKLEPSVFVNYQLLNGRRDPAHPMNLEVVGLLCSNLSAMQQCASQTFRKADDGDDLKGKLCLFQTKPSINDTSGKSTCVAELPKPLPTEVNHGSPCYVFAKTEGKQLDDDRESGPPASDSFSKVCTAFEGDDSSELPSMCELLSKSGAFQYYRFATAEADTDDNEVATAYPAYITTSKEACQKEGKFGFEDRYAPLNSRTRRLGYGAVFFIDEFPHLFDGDYTPIDCYGAAFYRPTERYAFGQCFPANPTHEFKHHDYGHVTIEALKRHCGDSNGKMLKVYCFSGDFKAQVVAFVIQAAPADLFKDRAIIFGAKEEKDANNKCVINEMLSCILPSDPVLNVEKERLLLNTGQVRMRWFDLVRNKPVYQPNDRVPDEEDEKMLGDTQGWLDWNWGDQHVRLLPAPYPGNYACEVQFPVMVEPGFRHPVVVRLGSHNVSLNCRCETCGCLRRECPTPAPPTLSSGMTPSATTKCKRGCRSSTPYSYSTTSKPEDANWYIWAIIAVVAFVLVMVCVCCCVAIRRRRKARKENEDIEGTAEGDEASEEGSEEASEEEPETAVEGEEGSESEQPNEPPSAREAGGRWPKLKPGKTTKPKPKLKVRTIRAKVHKPAPSRRKVSGGGKRR